MTRKTMNAEIAIDLAMLAGTMTFVPGSPLPRDDKQGLEGIIAKAFLTHLSRREGSTFSDLAHPKSDPPDVMFNYNGEPRRMELTEIAPEKRYEKDDIIRKLRRAIIGHLTLGERTAGFVVNIFLPTITRPNSVLARYMPDWQTR